MAVLRDGVAFGLKRGGSSRNCNIHNFGPRNEENRSAFIAGRSRSLAGIGKCSAVRGGRDVIVELRFTRSFASIRRNDGKSPAVKSRTACKNFARGPLCRTGAARLDRSPTIEEDVGVQERQRFSGVSDVLGNARTLEELTEGVENHSEKSLADWEADARVRRSCEAGSSLRVAVLLSGGVDSSVALRLLCNAGHSCTAFYLKIWFQEDFENLWSACPWEDDLSFAQSVCDEAGVELKIAHLTGEYWQNVVSDSILEIQAGRTPNPDMLCNSRIKFGEFLKHIGDKEFDRVASGHYARVKRIENGTAGQTTQLFLSADEAKDQTYFLSQLSQAQLSRLMFPVGDLTKGEVRELAKLMVLPNKQRRDSQGICFLGKVKFSEFVARHLGEREGALVEAETGDILGVHKGFWFYTIGQRQGIGLSNGPWFVVAKDIDYNVVFISRKYFSAKKRQSFRVGSFNWISGLPPTSLAHMRCKVRHGPHFYNCTLNFNEETADSLVGDVTLDRDDQGLAPGQYTAFYQGDECLGSGIISQALGEETSFNVSPRAFEVAKSCSDTTFFKDRKRTKNPSRSNTKLNEDVLKPSRVSNSDGSSRRSHLKVSGKSLVDANTESLGDTAGEKTSSGERGNDIWWASLLPARFFSWLQGRFLR